MSEDIVKLPKCDAACYTTDASTHRHTHLPGDRRHRDVWYQSGGFALQTVQTMGDNKDGPGLFVVMLLCPRSHAPRLSTLLPAQPYHAGTR